MLITPSTNPEIKFFIFRPIPDVAFFTYLEKINPATIRTANIAPILSGLKFFVNNSYMNMGKILLNWLF